MCRRVGAEVTISPGNNAAVSRVRGHTGSYIVSLASALTILYYTSLRCCIELALYLHSIQNFCVFAFIWWRLLWQGKDKGAQCSKFVAETLPSGAYSPQNCVMVCDWLILQHKRTLMGGKNPLSNFQHTNNMLTHRSASPTITQGRESPHLHTACRSRAGCVRCGSAQILSSMDQCINSPVETNNYIWEEAGGAAV